MTLRFLCVILLSFVVSKISMAEDLIVPVIDFYDADTAEIRLTLPAPLNKAHVRILGIDSPEVPAASYKRTGKLGRAKCIKEAELALVGKAFVKTLSNSYGNQLYLTNYKWDKYGGRILAHAYFLDKNTQERISIAKLLLDQGLAIPYNGGKRTHDWCSD